MEHEYANEHCKTGVVGQTITNKQKMKKKKRTETADITMQQILKQTGIPL